MIQSTIVLATDPTCSEKSRFSGHTAAHSTCRESTMAITVRTPPTTRPMRRRVRALPVSCTKDWFLITAAVVARSSMIARKTTARPATMPSPTLRMINASTTGLPSPGAPMSAAITTKDSAARVVWLTPRMIVCLAMGSCTLRSSCHLVDPIDCAASIGPARRLRTACAVMRMQMGTL